MREPRHPERMIPVPYTYTTHRRRNSSFISPFIKYILFFFNFFFLLFGGALIAIGLYALVEQWKTGDGVRVNSVADLLFNVGLIIATVGAVIFFVSFAGCIGALRENTTLLQLYSVALVIFFLLELTLAILCFVFPTKVEGIVSDTLSDNVIKKYREDKDLQNLIDFIQLEFHCCGLSSKSYEDWNKNEYFNCDTPKTNTTPIERCGVPYSCCKNPTDMSSGLVNIMCGYGVQRDRSSKQSSVSIQNTSLLQHDPKEKIWTQGCIESLKSWINRNLYIVAGIAVGVAAMQLLVMYLAKSLEGQIDLQKST